MSKKKTKHANKEKAKKEKIVYVDDGSTIVDMSGTVSAPKKAKNQPKDPYTGAPLGNSFKDQARTYFKAVKQNLVPMFVVILGICVIFGVMYLILELAS
ncbi:MAG: hypothetical protein IJ033_02115 [Clostridia bacterium]|nr:hypothetical protein [Clostridia bacterium]